MSLPLRRVRSVSPKPATVSSATTAVAPSSSQPQAQSSSQQQQQQQQQQQHARFVTPAIVPAVEVTPEANELIHKMRESCGVYRNIIQSVEKCMMQGILRGDEERHIMLECQRVLNRTRVIESDVKLSM